MAPEVPPRKLATETRNLADSHSETSFVAGFFYTVIGNRFPLGKVNNKGLLRWDNLGQMADFLGSMYSLSMFDPVRAHALSVLLYLPSTAYCAGMWISTCMYVISSRGGAPPDVDPACASFLSVCSNCCKPRDPGLYAEPQTYM